MLRLLLLAIPLLLTPVTAQDRDSAWPEPTLTSRPWLRWFWPGGVADEASITRQLEEIDRMGFGGVCLSNSPGQPGMAARYRPWLGPGWLEMFVHAAREAERLGLGLDLDTGSGRPLGGPWVTPEMTALTLNPIILQCQGGLQSIEIPNPTCLFAWPPVGEPLDLLPFVEEGTLRWDAPPGSWTILGIAGRPTPQQVLDPSPGGEGPILDPFSPASMARYLDRIDEALIRYDAAFPRARFLDASFEIDADWSESFLGYFEKMRGYDLRSQLPALYGEGEGGTIERVLGDYRESLAELQQETLAIWHHWAGFQGSRSRAYNNNGGAHPLDRFLIADIPGVGIDDRITELDRLNLNLAASAAHLTRKPLVAAEASRHASDAFDISPTDLTHTTDQLFLGGANHLFFHGITLAPDGAPWPGPLSARAPHLGVTGGLLENLPAFVDYTTRCQGILQTGAPDPEVLLYFPAHDFWNDGDAPLPGALERWLELSGFGRAFAKLAAAGVPFDIVSDRMLSNSNVENGRILIGDLRYKTLILPELRRLSEKTALTLLETCQRGGRLTVIGDWPQDVPGFPLPDLRRGTLFSALGEIPNPTVSQGDDLIGLLAEQGISAEPMVSRGLAFVRRTHEEGHHYFIVNRTDEAINAWIPLATPARSAVLMDPRLPKRVGLARSRESDSTFEFYLTLEPGESRILRTFTDRQSTAPDWPDLDPSLAIHLSGNWQVDFLRGGPSFPSSFNSPILGSWTTHPDAFARTFSGTASYRLEFDLPESAGEEWLLDLGSVGDSARVSINGKPAGTTWSPPFRVDPGPLLKTGTNLLEVEVTSLHINRVAEPSSPPRPSGLLGPVRLILLD